jgi:hypothetical protein
MSLDVYSYGQEEVERAFTGNYLVHGDISKAQCVIGASFAYTLDRRGNIKPGLSNQDMAKFVIGRFVDLPKILQFEIADAYIELGGNRNELIRISEARDPNQRLDTPELIEQAKTTMDKNSWGVAALVAHPNHMPYVDFLCKKAGIETVVPAGLEDVRFDSDSAQYWTVSLKAWQKELLARDAIKDPRKVIKE